MKARTLHTIIWKEEKTFVAKFLELELASQGKTKEEAAKNLKEALDLYLEDENVSSISFPSINEVTTQSITLQ